MTYDSTPSGDMEAAGSEPVDEPVCPCNGGNRYWLENSSDWDVSCTFSAGGVVSPVLPRTNSTDTRVPNTVEGSGGALEMTINGTTTTVIESVDTSLLAAPEDLRAGLIVGPHSIFGPEPLSPDANGIAFTAEAQEVSISQFLPPGVSSADTEIDLVAVLEGAQAEGALPPGSYSVDSLGESGLRWFMYTLLINTATNSSDVARATVEDAFRVFNVRSVDQMRSFLREVMVGARFTVKPIASWGGKVAVIFKGRTAGRAFLTSAMYGMRNSKVGYVSAFAEVASGQATAGTVARGAVKGNLIGFLVATVIEVADFIQNEDPEKNWGTLLAGLGVQFSKVFIAGVAGILVAGAVAASVAAAPVILVVGVGLAVSIAVGVGLEWLDEAGGISEGARKIGTAFGGAVLDAVRSVRAFIEFIATADSSTLDRMVDDWNRVVDNMIEDAARADPGGYCFFTCDNIMDALDGLAESTGAN